ncbi:hypothetical protein Hanom_Chr14g01252411 [Helianthus anomalus]
MRGMVRERSGDRERKTQEPMKERRAGEVPAVHGDDDVGRLQRRLRWKQIPTSLTWR